MKYLVALLLTSAFACRPPPRPGFLSDAGACGPVSVDASESCVKPCTAGNEKGVGMFCTAGGGECQFPAFICTVDGDPTSKDTFCTLPCSTDLQCGSNAACRGDPAKDGGGSKGCVPSACL